jgi:predicted transposase YbfD/YdcC
MPGLGARKSLFTKSNKKNMSLCASLKMSDDDFKKIQAATKELEASHFVEKTLSHYSNEQLSLANLVLKVHTDPLQKQTLNLL